MDRTWLRAAQKLEFKDPHSFLLRLRNLEIEVALSDTPEHVKSLRLNGLKNAREQREAALFCEGMSRRLGQTVFFASHEDQDYDFVASWVVQGLQHLAPVQLKEVVPKALNANATLDSVLRGLEKYADPSGLNVAIHLNQSCHFDPLALHLQHSKIASVWIFAAASADQSLWNLWGDFTKEDPYGTQFAYPGET